MNINTHLVICDDDSAAELTEFMSFFSLRNTSVLTFSTENASCSDGLEKLVYLIARKPKCLINHVQRIYHCFRSNLHEQLFAAIVDFLVVLNQRGQDISWRMVLGTKSHLKPEQFELFCSYLRAPETETRYLPGNQYSIFAKGFLGVNKMISQVEKFDENNDDDPLMIARDHIEYSQLGEAKMVLERAIIENPERQDLQMELLELFKSTRDFDGFQQMLTELTQLSDNIANEWNQLNNYFNGLNKNG